MTDEPGNAELARYLPSADKNVDLDSSDWFPETYLLANMQMREVLETVRLSHFV